MPHSTMSMIENFREICKKGASSGSTENDHENQFLM